LRLTATMRKQFPVFLLLLLAAAVLAGAQSGHITPFTGTWKLNVAKSSFNPGPPFQSFTLTFKPDGTRNLDLVRANGQSQKISLPWSDGKEVTPAAAQAMDNTRVISKIQGNTVDDTWRQSGTIIEKVHGVVSPDR